MRNGDAPGKPSKVSSLHITILFVHLYLYTLSGLKIPVK